jgi:hypothetical protein
MLHTMLNRNQSKKNPRSKRGFIIASSTHRVKLKANDKFLIKELLITQRRR